MTADQKQPGERSELPDDERPAGQRSREDVEADEDGVARRQSEAGAPDQEDASTRPEPADGPRAEAAGEVEALNERFLRLAAEYDNYRKRTERERSESWVRAQAEIVRGLLEPLDDLQRVADYTAEGTGVEALVEGVQMVERKLLRALESAGLEAIDAAGERFDPGVHEALMTTPTEDPEEDDSVGQVFQKGYQFKGLLLRPARVQVRKVEG